MCIHGSVYLLCLGLSIPKERRQLRMNHIIVTGYFNPPSMLPVGETSLYHVLGRRKRYQLWQLGNPSPQPQLTDHCHSLLLLAVVLSACLCTGGLRALRDYIVGDISGGQGYSNMSNLGLIPQCYALRRIPLSPWLFGFLLVFLLGNRCKQTTASMLSVVLHKSVVGRPCHRSHGLPT